MSALITRSSIILVVLEIFFVICARSQSYDLDKIRSIFVSNVLDTISHDSTITTEDIQIYFEKYNIKFVNSTISDCVLDNKNPPALDEKCLLEKCLDPDDVYRLSGLSEGSSDTHLTTLSTIILHLLENSDCVEIHNNHTELEQHVSPSSGEAWGFGILCTTLINLCSLTGVVALPFIHGDAYKKVLIYMVGLAVGTLAGSSLLFLIPEALELTDQELNEHSYVWKCLVILSGIFVFFNIERVLKIITENRERAKNYNVRRRTTSATMDFSSFHVARPVSDYKNVDDLPHMSPCGNKESQQSSESVSLSDKEESLPNGELQKIETKEDSLEEGSLIQHKRRGHGHHHRVEPVAWMIIFGDGLHNFIDGVSIGAAFTESILAGVSVSVAILCEELPHELGDFAVLLNAGMRMKKAVFYNFLSACTCYLGLIVGIFLGENTASHTWVFAFAGGMFLYISLVDMMPEMTAAAEVDENKNLSVKLIFFLQNFGMLSGFVIMLLMAIYGGNLEAAIKGEL